jgi:hypothetical protein
VIVWVLREPFCIHHRYCVTDSSPCSHALLPLFSSCIFFVCLCFRYSTVFLHSYRVGLYRWVSAQVVQRVGVYSANDILCLNIFEGDVIRRVGNLTKQKSLYVQRDHQYGDFGSHCTRMLKIDWLLVTFWLRNDSRHYIMMTQPQRFFGHSIMKPMSIKTMRLCARTHAHTHTHTRKLATCFHARFLRGLFFDPEDGGDQFLRNVGRLSTDHTMLYPKRYYSYM